ncbi:hypothetical protein C8R44DRAFT_341818 [Mycena epipterygia]|nr:hypothetical protein C8R44DRAFT_341818 [Mycena epipterygia]
MHPNLLHFMGCSPDVSPEPFLVYHGGLEGSAEQILASVLRKELLRCLIMGVTMVNGISSGLCYLASKGCVLEYLNSEDFDLIISTNGNLAISIKQSVTSRRDGVTVTDVGANPQLDLFDSLCRRVSWSTHLGATLSHQFPAFREANQILYRDFPISHTASLIFR